MPESRPGLVNTLEAARLLGISREAVWKHCRSGTLPAVRVGRRFMVCLSALEDAAVREASERRCAGSGHRLNVRAGESGPAMSLSAAHVRTLLAPVMCWSCGRGLAGCAARWNCGPGRDARCC